MTQTLMPGISGMPTEVSLTDLAQSVLQQVKQQGADQAELNAVLTQGFEVVARGSAAEQLSQCDLRQLTLTVYVNQRVGTASTADFSPDALNSVISKALSIAQYTQPDPAAGLADKSALATDLNNYDADHPWTITPKEAMEKAIACDREAHALDARLMDAEGCTMGSDRIEAVYANTHDFIGLSRRTLHHASYSAVVRDADGVRQCDYDSTSARDVSDWTSPTVVAQRAVEKAIAKCGARRLTTRQCPVLFVPRIARHFWGTFLAAIAGGNLYRRTSFLVNSLGKSIFPTFVHLHQRPHLLKAIGSTAFDEDGVATREQDYVTEGCITRYILSHYSAMRLGLSTTGNSGGVFNLCVDPMTLSQADLIKKMDRGLIVTDVMGQGVNLVTGDYSKGASGFWVEHGEIQYPVDGITIAGQLRDLYANIVALSDDVNIQHNTRCGSLLLENMVIAGE